MPSCRIPLFALSMAALPVAAGAQETPTTGAQILACETDRTAQGCATLLSRIFVCDGAPEMKGCEALLGLRTAAVDVAEREAEMNGTGEDADDDETGIISEPEEDENEVEVRAEGELVEELEEEALTDGEERLREDDDTDGIDDATGRPEADDTGGEGAMDGNDDEASDMNGAAAGGAVDGNAAGDDNADSAADTDAPVVGEMACPVLDSSDWAAWVNAMPGPEGPSLIVTGVVTLPTPGYTVTLEQGSSDRSAQPVQVVRLTLEAPTMNAAQVLTAYDVRFEMPSAAPVDANTAPFSGVRVVCGEQELALIEPVDVVH